MSRKIKTLIIEPAPSEGSPDAWAVESRGVDPDVPGAEPTVAREVYPDEQTARLYGNMIYRQVAARPPAFVTSVDQATNRTVFERDI